MKENIWRTSMKTCPIRLNTKITRDPIWDDWNFYVPHNHEFNSEIYWERFDVIVPITEEQRINEILKTMKNGEWLEITH